MFEVEGIGDIPRRLKGKASMKWNCKDSNNYSKWTTENCFKDLWIFEEFDKDQLKKVKGIGLRRNIEKEASVFMQGERANEMFLIKYGRIKLCKIHKDGSEAILDFRKAGDIISTPMFRRNWPAEQAFLWIHAPMGPPSWPTLLRGGSGLSELMGGRGGRSIMCTTVSILARVRTPR
jgi:hypothetical protein